MKTMILVNNLSKKYKLGQIQPYLTIRDSIANFVKNPISVSRKDNASNEFWSLKNINLEVKEGEILGIIGANGAGKSTLLKILSRITPPTQGSAKIFGRVGSLLEVGTGFHPELTGRENIYLNGAILGMRRREISLKFDEIVEFSEIEKFIDTPVKHYSSGMYVRLAFAVAAHLEPEILLIDEVLSVGDAKFQEKSLKRMNSISSSGRTVVFVSHNLGAVSELCTRVAYLKSGKLELLGSPQEVISKYISDSTDGDTLKWSSEDDESKHLQIKEVSIDNKSGIDINDDIKIKITSHARKLVVGSVIVLELHRNGIEIFRTYDTDAIPSRLKKRKIGISKDKLLIPKGILKAGSYQLIVSSAVLHKNWSVDKGNTINFIISETTEDTSFKAYASYRSGLIRLTPIWESDGEL